MQPTGQVRRRGKYPRIDTPKTRIDKHDTNQYWQLVANGIVAKG
jgi:hypothetical protein